MPKSRKRKRRPGRKESFDAQPNGAVLPMLVAVIALPVALSLNEFEPVKIIDFPPGRQADGETMTAAMRSMILTQAAAGMDMFCSALLLMGNTLTVAFSLFGDEEEEDLPDLDDLRDALSEFYQRNAVPLPVFRDGAQWVEAVDYGEVQKMLAELLPEDE